MSVSHKQDVFLVIGASGTIGSAVARKLAVNGATLGLHYCHNLAAVERLQAELEQLGAHCICIQSMLDTEETVRQFWELACSMIGVPCGIAICGGRVQWREWQHLAEQDWYDVMFEHCIAPFLLTQQAVPLMQKNGTGSVVYLSSIAAKYGGSPRTLHYAAAKSALEAAMHGLARDVAKATVRINGVRAGVVHSPQQLAGRSPQQLAERIAKIPMGREGGADEIAGVIAFLLSDEASFMTGELVTVAGGD